MPLAVRAVQALPPPTLATAAPGPVIFTNPPVGTMRATWIDPTGVEWDLSSPNGEIGWFTRPGVAGWGAAPVTIVTDPLARGGVSVRHQRDEPSRLTWPVHIWGDTHMEWLTRYRQLMRAFTLTKRRGAGIMRVARPDGSAREIPCLYEDGFGGEPNENHDFANPVLTLFCPDGFWRDVVPQTVRRSYAAAPTPYLAPYPTVSSGQVLGATTIDNDGDIEVWPSWQLTGPATQLVATNVTTGKSFTLTHNLLAGEIITIIRTPTRTLVRGPGDVNLIGKLNFPSAVLWSLLPGPNDIDFQVSGSGPGTDILLSYYRRYEGA